MNELPHPVPTGANNVTKLYSAGDWNGEVVIVEADGLGTVPLCAPHEHDLHQVHHYGDYGDNDRDYGPTGFLTCRLCLGWAKEPDK